PARTTAAMTGPSPSTRPASRGCGRGCRRPSWRPGSRADRRTLLVLGDDGRRRFLGDDRLCAIPARYGEGLLRDDCALFPRILGRIDDRRELAATLSCPEIARLVLIADDGLEPAVVSTALVGRGLVDTAVDTRAGDLYERSFPAVRARALAALAERGFPL